jgi:transposase
LLQSLRALAQGVWGQIMICFSPHLYRARRLVERFFNKIKQCRRVATRESICSSNALPQSAALRPRHFSIDL